MMNNVCSGLMVRVTNLRRNSAVRQASELPEEQINFGILVCPNPKASRTNPEAFLVLPNL